MVRRLRPHGRKVWVTVHVVSSVGWLTADLAVLALGLAGVLTDDPANAGAAYRAIGLLLDSVLLPLAATALLSGVWLGLATKWGLIRYWWVLAKLVITVGAGTATLLALRPHVRTAVGAIESGGGPAAVGDTAESLVVAPIVAGTLYLSATVLSYWKPWGRRTGRNGRTAPAPHRPRSTVAGQ